MTSIESAYRLADERMDADDKEAAIAINFCAGTALGYHKHLLNLAWACNEKDSKKRRAALQVFLAEMAADGESLAGFPTRDF
jgi:hypothetical protein